MDTTLAEFDIKSHFPDIEFGKFRVTSDATPQYNCIAWAAGENHRYWWPDSQYYWPSLVPRKRSVEAFVQAFGLLGYVTCPDSGLEPEFEKIAIFVGFSGTPTHAARQLEDGNWTSKLGQSYDISHILEQVGGNKGHGYGRIVVYMKRPRQG